MIRTEMDLMDHIQYYAEIKCCKCRTIDSDANASDMYTPEKFFKKGWRATTAKVYCPACAKKYLKG